MAQPMTEAELLVLPAVVELETAGRAFGFGRTKSFELAQAGEFPCRVLTLGNRYRVTMADILAALGLSTPLDVEPGRESGRDPAINDLAATVLRVVGQALCDLADELESTRPARLSRGHSVASTPNEQRIDVRADSLGL